MQAFALFFLSLALIFQLGCSSSSSNSPPAATTTLSLSMTRLAQTGVDPFRVDLTVKINGAAVAGQTLTLDIPKGSVSSVTDNANGTYSFTVTPSATGVYPVQISVNGVSISRQAVVLDTLATGVSQPMTIPGNFVNTEGYEDGVTITPDGQYLFVQYGPIYFSGIPNITTICNSVSLSVGYDLNTCDGRTNSGLIFSPIGPYNNEQRPNFHSGAIVNNKVRHLPGLVIGGTANGLQAPPTMFYGFKRQVDGTFSEPFTLSFDDTKGINGPFGLSFKMNGDGTGTFILAWNNFLNDLGDDKADIYSGTITFGQNNSLGTVTYGAAFNGDSFQTITPLISPVGFTSHVGTQGNPHLYYDTSGVIKSIWTDDENVTHNLSVYQLTAGTFPNGTWTVSTLPSDINTGAEEDQPFFTGEELIFSRDGNIVSHDYTPTNGACSSSYTHNDCWGPEVILIGANGNTTAGEIFSVGEPTVAEYDGKRFLYFVFVKVRDNQNFPGIVDYNLDPAFVEIP